MMSKTVIKSVLLLTSATLLLLVATRLRHSVYDNTENLPDPPARILLEKKFSEASHALAFDGKTVTIVDPMGIHFVNVESSVVTEPQLEGSIKNRAGEARPILMEGDGAYVSLGDIVFYVSVAKPPKTVYQFSSRIRWTASQKDYAVILTKDGDVALLADGQVKILSHEVTTVDAIKVRDHIELIKAGKEESSTRKITKEGFKETCTVKGEMVTWMILSEDSKTATGLVASENRGANSASFVGIDCPKKALSWKKSVYRDFLNGAKGQEHLYNQGQFSLPFACGVAYCASLSVAGNTIVGGTDSGVLCVEPASGQKLIHHFLSSKGSGVARLAPAICSGNRLVMFQNIKPVLLTQTIPAKVETVQPYMDEASNSILYKAIDHSSFATNVIILPIAAGGRIAFVTGKSELVVIGK